MNFTHLIHARRHSTPLAVVAVAALLTVAAGCARDRMFTINGQVVTKDEYIRALERQTVTQGRSQTTALRAAVESLVDNQVVLAEAAKDNVMPSKDQVTRYYNTQKEVFLAANPGKDYEKAMADEGTTPEDLQAQMSIELAEAAVYARRLNITDGDVRTAYNQASQRGGFGLPRRVRLRLVMPASPAEFADAQKALSQPNADFNAVAARINPPQLKVEGGLLPNPLPVSGLGPAMATRFDQTAEGAFFGPVPFQVRGGTKPLQVWIKVDKKLPGLGIPFADAQDMVRIQLVQLKLRDAAGQPARQALMQETLDASFDADPRYVTVWNAMKVSKQQVIATQQSIATAPNSPGAVLANSGGVPDAASASLTK